MITNLRERLTRYQSFIRPKVHFALEFSVCKIVAKTGTAITLKLL